ncbi:MAG: hypothetical protein RIT04_349 [Candidatus Parcubacteria bacterium]
MRAVFIIYRPFRNFFAAFAALRACFIARRFFVFFEREVLFFAFVPFRFIFLKITDYERCFETSFVISNMFTTSFPPKTFLRAASALILRLFEGS